MISLARSTTSMHVLTEEDAGKALCGFEFSGPPREILEVDDLEEVRTGPADFSYKFVKRLWDFGLRSTEGHIEDAAGKTIPTPEEEDAFRACRLPYIEPEDRENIGVLAK